MFSEFPWNVLKRARKSLKQSKKAPKPPDNNRLQAFAPFKSLAVLTRAIYNFTFCQPSASTFQPCDLQPGPCAPRLLAFTLP